MAEGLFSWRRKCFCVGTPLVKTRKYRFATQSEMFCPRCYRHGFPVMGKHSSAVPTRRRAKFAAFGKRFAIWSVHPPKFMFKGMISIGKHYQVFQSIVSSYAVYVVNMLMRIEETAKVPLHDKAMLKNKPIPGLWVVAASYQDVSMIVD